MFKNHGFTLIELLVTIAVAAVLLGLAAPNLSVFVQNGRVKGAAADVWTSLTMARGEALKRNKDVVVEAVSADWRNGWDVKVGTDILHTHGPLGGGFEAATESSLTKVTYQRDGRLKDPPDDDYIFVLKMSGKPQVTQRCVFLRASGLPVVKADSNRDGNCAND